MKCCQVFKELATSQEFFGCVERTVFRNSIIVDDDVSIAIRFHDQVRINNQMPRRRDHIRVRHEFAHRIVNCCRSKNDIAINCDDNIAGYLIQRGVDCGGFAVLRHAVAFAPDDVQCAAKSGAINAETKAIETQTLTFHVTQNLIDGKV
jgi:hypothetical protein